jgi:outer membrane beta-barrel protein
MNEKRKNNQGWFLCLTLIAIFITPKAIHAAEDSLYDFLWLDPDKSVYVLQNKTYKKKNRFFAGINGIKVVGNEFLSSFGGDLNVGYYFTEEWGFVLSYTHYSNSFNDNYDNIVALERVPFLRRFTSLVTANALWTPFYGKVNTFNRIIYFDWGFKLGIAAVKAESNLESVAEQVSKEVQTATSNTVFKEESYVGISYGTDFRVHLNESFYINLELRNTTYSGENSPADPTSKALQTHTDVLFGVGFNL